MKSFSMTCSYKFSKLLAPIVLSILAASAFASDASLKNGEFIDCKAIAGKAETSCLVMLSAGVPIAEVAVNFSGDVVKANFTEYPAQGESTALLMLVDISDPKRAKAVAAAADLIRQVVNKKQPHQHIAIAQFDGSMQLLADFNADAAATTSAINRIASKGYATELYKSAIETIALLKKNPANRKSLVIFSDGKAEDRGYKHEDVIKEALNAGVMIFTIGYPESPSDTPYLQTLERLSKESGGIHLRANIADKSAAVGTTERILAYSENGGTVTFPNGEKFGEQKINLKIKLEDDSTIDLASTVELPDTRATSKKLTDDLKQNKSTYAGLILLIIALIAALLWYRKRKKSKIEPITTYALLEELSGDGSVFPLQKKANRIGRAPDNDVCFTNSTVSSYHAEINIRRDGAVFISDLGSSNGTYVNDKKINQEAVAFGAVIEIGEVRLRLRRADE